MFDTAIIGTGPAGLSAALTLHSLNVSFIWFGSKELSQKVFKAEKIRNYPGLINVSGNEMKDIFLSQIKEMNIEITDKIVTGVYDMTSHYGILCNQEMYEAKSVILATGVESFKNIPGELDYVGQGVSYCATCDGLLYKNKDIVVVCTDKEYEEEVKFLASIANRIYFFPIYKNVNVNIENVEIINSSPREIKKDNKKMYVYYQNKEIIVDGVFMLKSSIAPNILVSGLNIDNGHIIIDRMCQTNMKGIFAAGDCTGRPYQYAKAVGEGNIAAHSVKKYLSEK